MSAEEWMARSRPFEDVLAVRRSCRSFLQQPVPRPTIERLLGLAQRAPSWCNTQPWQVVVTEGKGTDRFRAELLEHVSSAGNYSEPDFPMPERYEGVYLERRRESGWQLYNLNPP